MAFQLQGYVRDISGETLQCWWQRITGTFYSDARLLFSMFPLCERDSDVRGLRPPPKERAQLWGPLSLHPEPMSGGS